MRAWLRLAALAAVVGALSAWVYYRPDVAKSASYALSPLKAAEVKRIRLERLAPAADTPSPADSAGDSEKDPPAAAPVTHAPSAQATIELERRDGAWRVTAPFTARAETFQVERLLALLDARSVARFPAAGLDRYGLAPPQSRVTLDGQSFGFGAVNTATREQYVLTDGAVYAIPLAQRIAIPRDADALISRALFAPGEAPVRFTLPGFSAALEDGAWRFTPALEDTSADDRNAWAQRWREALAVRAARHDGRTPESTVEVGLKNGGTLALGVLQREPELVVLRPDEGVQYHFFADTAKRLLAAPGGSTTDAAPK